MTPTEQRRIRSRWHRAAAAGRRAVGVPARPQLGRPVVRPEPRRREGRPVLVRIGSRGSRLALTQAEQAAAALRGPGVEVAFVPITTAGDRDRKRPFGADRRARRLRQGDRGGAARRPHRRRRALGEGHDLDRHRRARRSARTSSATTRATRSSAPTRARAGHAHRHRLRAAAGAAARARADALDRADARQRRHAAAQAARARPRRDRARRLRPRPARARATRSALRLDPELMLPEAAQGALALQVRAGEEELVARGRPRRDAPPRRARARLRRADRRRLPRAGRRPPRRLDACTR